MKRIFYLKLTVGLIIILLVVLVSIFLFYFINLNNYKFDLFKKQITVLQDQIQKLANEQEKVSLSQNELANRQSIRQKSQDELLTSAVSKVAPAVVSIVVSKDVPKLEVVYKNPFGDDPFFKDFGFRVPVYQQKGVEKQRVGAGTGFIISSDGYIVTNRHVVVDQSADYTVLLADGTQKNGQVVYRDEVHDIAIIKINSGNYSTVQFGQSSSLKLGQSVIAIGNALGQYNNSVSVGIISGLNRDIIASGAGTSEALKGVIQTDAAINPGNSGGPLLDLDGKVVGMNVATVIGSNNISFAIPSDKVLVIINSVLGNKIN